MVRARDSAQDSAAGDPSWSADRYYLPRPAWVWNLQLNPQLEAAVYLRANLSPTLRSGEELHKWASLYRPDPDDGRTFLSGGAAMTIESSEGALSVLFSSGGQDALESLTTVVQEFHEHVLRNNPHIEVLWQELPLR